MREPRGIAADARGGLFVAGDTSVSSFDPEGRRTGSFDTGDAAFCVAVDFDGGLVLGMKDHVEIRDPEGARREAWAGLGEDARLSSVAASATQVVAADAGNRLVWRFDRSGALAGTVGEEPRPGGIAGFVVPSPFFDVAFGPDGSLWIADPGRQKVERYSPDGTWKSSWGRASMDVDGFCG
jgi:streptogramin lyase